MAEDWLADVRRYDADADEGVVAKIVRHCGIALRTRDASLVSFTDSKETDRVRESFLKKKLARTDEDAVLDAAIAAVGERMKEDHDKNRVTVYYLLAQHFGQLDVFGGTAGGASAAAAAASAAATATTVTAATTASTPPEAAAPTPPPAPAPAPTPAPMPTPTPAPAPAPAAEASAAATAPMAFAASTGGASGHSGDTRKAASGSDDFTAGCLGGLAVLGALILALGISIITEINILPEPAPEPVAVAAPAPAPPPEPAVPDGAGVVASERDGFPMLTVYFDIGSSEVTPDFEAVSADLRAYLDDDPDTSVQISGFNDPSGDAELNAALSRDRAMGVQAALVNLGLAEARTDLVRPDDTTTTDMTPAEARRVEITVVE